MNPILFQNTYFPLPAWHVFFVLAALTCYFLLMRIGPSRQLDPNFLNKLFIICYISAYFGARSLSLLIEEPSYFFSKIFTFGSMTYYGGFLTAIGAGTLYALKQKNDLKKLYDLCLPIGLIGLGIGRIGCFLNGDDYGIPSKDFGFLENFLPSVTFPYHQIPIQRFPVQLLESGFGLLFGSYLLKKKNLAPSTASYLGAGGYSIFRFFVEYLRADEDRGFLFHGLLSTSQVISLLILLVVFLFFKKTTKASL